MQHNDRAGRAAARGHPRGRKAGARTHPVDGSIEREPPVGASAERDRVRRRLARIAWLLDSSITLPGLRFRIGLDPLLGLIPGIGDLLGVLLSSYIVREAARVGAPPSVLARMAWNVALEGLVGVVPLLGDVFDAAWKANQRNVALLEAHLDRPQRTARSSRWFVALLIAGLIALLIVVGAAGFLLLQALVSAFSA